MTEQDGSPGASEGAPPSGSRPRALVLSSNYPNRAFPTRGLWVRRLVEVSRAVADPVVVAPVPYVPPLVPLPGEIRRWRTVERHTRRDGLDVFHPRVPTGPGHLLHAVDAWLAYLPVRRVTDDLHARRAFDLIHAHFIYPEGVIAARLGRRYGVPVLTTEHSLWMPWLEDHAVVRAQVIRRLSGIDMITVVSKAVERTVRPWSDGEVPIETLPNVVDEETFHPPGVREARDPARLLFVGAVRRVKGLDVLIRAIDRLARHHPGVRLDVIGEPFFRAYRKDQEEVRELIRRLGLEDRVHFLGGKPPGAVAEAMRGAGMVVVPSRRESFSAVVLEALATGTPVVATRCGGPEEILDERTGVLVPPEDPGALAAAIGDVLSGERSFDASLMRSRVVERFGRRAAANRIGQIYGTVLRLRAGKAAGR